MKHEIDRLIFTLQWWSKMVDSNPPGMNWLQANSVKMIADELFNRVEKENKKNEE